MKELFDRLSVDRSNWRDVFSACLGKMMCVQNACGELVVQNENWNIDLGRGVIFFGMREYPIQFIGSVSKSSGTWLWGWENINHFPDEIIRLANETKACGEEWHLEPLTAAEFDLNDTYNGHNLSIVTCGLADGYAYYRCPHNGGAFFVGLSDVPDAVFDPVDFSRFISTVSQCIQQFYVDHRLLVEGFLRWNQTPYEWHGSRITAHFTQDLIIAFEDVDGARRISAIRSV